MTGAEVGNVRAMRSGFYAIAEIERNPRTAEIAAAIEAALPIAAPGDVFGVWLLAGMVERRIRGFEALEAAKSAQETAGLHRNLSTVENSIARMLDALGLTPRSRAALGLDLSRTGDELRRHLLDNYGGDE